jgi:hypothetical protein
MGRVIRDKLSERPITYDQPTPQPRVNNRTTVKHLLSGLGANRGKPQLATDRYQTR